LRVADTDQAIVAVKALAEAALNAFRAALVTVLVSKFNGVTAASVTRLHIINGVKCFKTSVVDVFIEDV